MSNFPYYVTIQGRLIFCGGAIVSNNFVLTAASCIKNKNINYYKIYSGRINLKGVSVRNAKKILLYEEYEPSKNDHDIALIKVDTPFDLNNFEKPIEIIKNIFDDSPPGHHLNVIASYINEWKLDKPAIRERIISVSNLAVNSRDVCNNNRYLHRIAKTEFCASFVNNLYSSFCYGTTGAPLVVDGYLIGIATKTSPRCGQIFRKQFNAFTKVELYKDWIEKNIQEFKNN